MSNPKKQYLMRASWWSDPVRWCVWCNTSATPPSNSPITNGGSSSAVSTNANANRSHQIPRTLYNPPLLVPLNQMPCNHIGIITDTISEVYNIETPIYFQYVGINYLFFNGDTYLFINRGLADGKSLIPQTTSLLRRGVAAMLEPLIGLGSDRVEKGHCIRHNA